MISRLASSLVDRFASDATHLLDPFCGSGAVLKAGNVRGIKVSGVDLNPFGVLLTGVKVQGFDRKRAEALCDRLLDAAESSPCVDAVMWDNKRYWFTPATLLKYERIRYAARQMRLHVSAAGRAVLLALGLSVRQCSRADQRSPKPFISKYAREIRRGTHFDPASAIRALLGELAELYGKPSRCAGDVYQLDVTNAQYVRAAVGSCSHVVTSPPYVNAQDYFRNFKLELYLLEGILPFTVNDIIHRFIGTERGVERGVLKDADADERRELLPELRYLEKVKVEQAVILHRYLKDMANAFRTMKALLKPGGTVVIVCGDNLIGGRRICTWRVLNKMLEGLSFVLFESFGDRIRNRAVAPKRSGHKGIIKQEIVSAFRLA
jgi:SAM-dependent methyltransferase